MEKNKKTLLWIESLSDNEYDMAVKIDIDTKDDYINLIRALIEISMESELISDILNTAVLSLESIKEKEINTQITN